MFQSSNPLCTYIYIYVYIYIILYIYINYIILYLLYYTILYYYIILYYIILYYTILYYIILYLFVYLFIHVCRAVYHSQTYGLAWLAHRSWTSLTSSFICIACLSGSLQWNWGWLRWGHLRREAFWPDLTSLVAKMPLTFSKKEGVVCCSPDTWSSARRWRPRDQVHGPAFCYRSLQRFSSRLWNQPWLSPKLGTSPMCLQKLASCFALWCSFTKSHIITHKITQYIVIISITSQYLLTFRFATLVERVWDLLRALWIW